MTYIIGRNVLESVSKSNRIMNKQTMKHLGMQGYIGLSNKVMSDKPSRD